MILRGTLPSSSMISAMWSARQTVARGEGTTNKTNNKLIRQRLGPRPAPVARVEAEEGTGQADSTLTPLMDAQLGCRRQRPNVTV